MVSPVSGVPQGPHHFRSSLSTNPWEQQFNEVSNQLLAGNSVAAAAGIEILYMQVSSYEPQTAQLSAAAAYLATAEHLLSSKPANVKEAEWCLSQAKEAISQSSK